MSCTFRSVILLIVSTIRVTYWMSFFQSIHCSIILSGAVLSCWVPFSSCSTYVIAGGPPDLFLCGESQNRSCDATSLLLGEQGWRSGESNDASHQCGPGSIPGLGTICGLSLLLLLVSALRVFLRVLRFSSLHKNQHSKFQFDQACMDTFQRAPRALWCFVGK